MATIVQNRELPGEIRVATVFDTGGTLRPIWLEQIDYPAEGRIGEEFYGCVPCKKG